MGERKGYYKILGIASDATIEEIKKAYREKSKENHPDTNSSEESENIQADLNEAYNTLGKPNRRKRYDEDTPENRIKKEANNLIIHIFQKILASTFDKNTLFINAQLAIDGDFLIGDKTIEEIKERISFLIEVRKEKITENTPHLEKAMATEIKTMNLMLEKAKFQKEVKIKAIEILQSNYKKEEQEPIPNTFLEHHVKNVYRNPNVGVDWRKFQ
jgi:DnaJ-class molecular chaperone